MSASAGDTVQAMQEAGSAPTMAAIAEFFDCDERQVRRWKKAGCPALQKPRGPYDLDALIAWHSENVTGGAAKKLTESLKDAQLRKEVANADKTEWQAKLERRKFETLAEAYVPREALDDTWSRFAAGLSRQLELLPRAAALELENVSRSAAEKILQRHVDDVRALAQREDFDRELSAREKAVDAAPSPHKTKATRRKRKGRKA